MIIIRSKENKNALTSSIRCRCYCEFEGSSYAAECGDEVFGCACLCSPETSGILVDMATNFP
jgi:hypothetical protein